MKRIETDAGFFRIRRGKIVRIPDEWVGATVHSQTIRKRKVKSNLKRIRRKKRVRLPL